MRRRKSTIFFVILGVLLISLAVALQVGWILLNLQQIALLVLGIVFFALLITGLVLNTTFLVREIRKNEQQDAFLNAVTHELKTPIASIRLYLDTLRSRDLSEEKRREFYDIMLTDSDRLLGTVEQVLAASRIKAKTRNSDESSFDLEEVLRDAIAQISNRHNLKSDRFRFISSGDPIEIEGVREDIETVFLNLLDNAVKYSGNAPEITVKLSRRQGSTAEVLVRDKGRGIPSSDQKNIFNRFYRGEAANGKNPKGTGLGLFIVKSIVEDHGGRIHLKSKGRGRGASFIVRLPASVKD